MRAGLLSVSVGYRHLNSSVRQSADGNITKETLDDFFGYVEWLLVNTSPV
jgi:hypothetical protein